MGPDDYDIALSGRSPRRIGSGALAPGSTIAQGETASMIVALPEGADQLRVRAQVSGATADLDLVPLLGDGTTESATDVPSTTALTAATEASVDVDLVGERLWAVKVANTDAGPDAVVDFIDLYPA